MAAMSSRYINELADVEQLGLRRITGILIDEFEGAFAPGVIERFIAEFLDETIPTAKVTAFLPLLAERSVRDRIRACPAETPRCPLPQALVPPIAPLASHLSTTPRTTPSRRTP